MEAVYSRRQQVRPVVQQSELLERCITSIYPYPLLLWMESLWLMLESLNPSISAYLDAF